MLYKEYNDNELINYISENSEEAKDIIYDKYKPFIVSVAKKMVTGCKNSGLDINDLIQEGMLGLNLAINHFSSKKEASFYTFAKTCIERKILSAVISANRQKHKILNESLSFDYESKDGEFINLSEFIGSNEGNPFEVVLNVETEYELISKIRSNLTSLEDQVFMLKINNFDYIEIANLLCKSPKSIDNALQRIKTKVKTILTKI